MKTKKIICMAFVFFSFKSQAFFIPNYNSQPNVIPQGSPLTPLCTNPLDPLCSAQWSSMATPMAVYPYSGLNVNWPSYQHFVPMFLANPGLLEGLQGLTAEDIENSEDWEPFKPSSTFFRDRKNKKRTSFWRNNSSKNVAAITEDDQGNKSIQFGTVNMVSSENLKVSQNGVIQTREDTIGLPTTFSPGGKVSSSTGCFDINKSLGQTEAAYCPSCERSQENSMMSFLSKISQGLRNRIQGQGMDQKIIKNLYQVSSRSEKTVSGKMAGFPGQICSPDISLKRMIANFERTCPAPYKNDFKKFFGKATCEACKQGVPPEIMMAMMSVESAGQCTAAREVAGESSWGLFQVDSRQHSCTDLGSNREYSRGSRAAKRCLRDPLNNLHKSIHILLHSYMTTNSGKLEQFPECKGWNSLSPQQRDKWRRAVSGYNGGPGWVLRAISSAKNLEKTLKNTGYLVGTERGRSWQGYETYPDSWEELRVYYFIEKFSPGNRSRSGRQLKNTKINLAHTEAVLGRNIPGSISLVDIWAKYRQDFGDVTCQ